MHTELGRCKLSDGHLYFETAGHGENIVFLHGFGLDSRMWAPQFEVLQSEYRVIRYDLRGFGRSSLPPKNGYAHEDDLSALLEELGGKPAHVVGFSAGGGVALRFTLAFPEAVRSLVLADSTIDGHAWSPEWQSRWDAIRAAARAGQLTEAKALWLEHPLFDGVRTDKTRAALLGRMINDYSGWHWLNRDTARLPSIPPSEYIKGIRVPTLVVIGERDLPDFQRIADYLASCIPTASRLGIRDSGHIVNLEAESEFMSGLLAFWRNG